MELTQVEELAAVNDKLVVAADDPFPDPDVLVALLREQARIEAVVAKMLIRFDQSEGYAPDGAKSTAAWVATRIRCPKSEVRRSLRLGRLMGDLPDAEQAFFDGEIGAAHVIALGRVKNPRTEADLRRMEEFLVDQAKHLTFPEFVRVLAYFQQHADPDGTEEAAELARLRRSVHLDASTDGMWFGSLTLDPISGEIVATELARLEDELFRQDWAEAKQRLGREPRLAELRRSPTQRRADALVEMATRSNTAPENGRRPAPLFTVLVGFETLQGRMCQLARGTVVAPGSLLPHLDEALVERAVFGPRKRVEIGARTRFFSGATRRGVEVRDRECVHAYCDEPGPDCEVDHIVPYSAGGETTQENGRLLCGFHNRLRNRDPFDTVERPPPYRDDPGGTGPPS